MKVKAARMQICIFNKYDYADDETRIVDGDSNNVYLAVSDIVRDLNAKHGGNLKINVLYCDIQHPQNQQVVAAYGMVSFPAVQVIAQYEDGSLADYGVPGGAGNPRLNRATLEPYITALLYDARGRNTLLCEAFQFLGVPQLCGYEKWIWAGTAIFAGQQAFETPSAGRKAAYGGLSAFAAYQFYRLGGIEDVKELFTTKK